MLIVGGKLVGAGGVVTKNWLDDPRWRLKAGEDRYARRGVGGRPPTVQIIVLHTTRADKDAPAPLRAGRGPYVDPATKTIAHWNSESDNSGAHLWVGPDGTVFQLADLLTEATPHCGNNNVNLLSVGIETYQEGAAGNLYTAQIEALIVLCDNLTRIFNITRRYQWPYLGYPPRALARPEEGGEGGVHYVGLCGHRDTSRQRGVEDPGNPILSRFGAAGYRPVNLDREGVGGEWDARNAGQNVLEVSRPGDNSNTVLLAAAVAATAWWISRRS